MKFNRIEKWTKCLRVAFCPKNLLGKQTKKQTKNPPKKPRSGLANSKKINNTQDVNDIQNLKMCCYESEVCLEND